MALNNGNVEIEANNSHILEDKENDALRMENQRIQLENIRMAKMLMKYQPKCRRCMKNRAPDEELIRENIKLTKEHQKVTNIALRVLGSPAFQPQLGRKRQCLG
ncbi:hypothetical protein CASFOL_012399 [Castilleja foliolosa]|uniref:Uncharacterized protein n=1 Tax=Castilleja foliolosa TaxID=1961234 RepID=A0ABD3DKF6_9LAMI